MKAVFCLLLVLASFSASAVSVRDGYGMSLEDYYKLQEQGKTETIQPSAGSQRKNLEWVCILKTKRDGLFEGEGKTRLLAEVDTRKNCQDSYAQGCSTRPTECVQVIVR